MINVPAGETALIVARFGATSFCSGSPGDQCHARILIGGVEADPVTGSGAPFDFVPQCVPDSGTCSILEAGEAHSFERWRTLGPGTYTVEVEFRTLSGSTFTVLGWTLEVDRIIV